MHARGVLAGGRTRVVVGVAAVAVARFGGVQWLESPRIARILAEDGIDAVQSPAEGELRASALKPEGGAAAETELEIDFLPEEYRRDARIFDVDCSGRICVSELRKMVRARERLLMSYLIRIDVLCHKGL